MNASNVAQNPCEVKDSCYTITRLPVSDVFPKYSISICKSAK